MTSDPIGYLTSTENGSLARNSTFVSNTSPDRPGGLVRQFGREDTRHTGQGTSRFRLEEEPTVANQQFSVYAKLHICAADSQTMPSERVLQALRGSFVRLAETLCREFASHAGQAFRLVSVTETGPHQEDRKYSTVVQVTIESTGEAAADFSTHWVVSAGNWMHAMAEAFPELRGTTTVGIERDMRRPAPTALSMERLPRAA